MGDIVGDIGSSHNHDSHFSPCLKGRKEGSKKGDREKNKSERKEKEKKG